MAPAGIESQLVDDRELTDAGSDRFRHVDVARQLADLVAAAPTPSSVALFAPWGAGKSSIYNFLQEELEERSSPVRIVRYDAFRYAKLPLQRHFLYSMAQALGVDAKVFGDDLYEGRQSNSIRLGDANGGRGAALRGLLGTLASLVAFAVALAVALLAAVVALAIVVSDTRTWGDFGDTFFDLAKVNLLGFLAPAGLLALVSGVASRSLWITRQRAAPTSEEEFGAAFEKLVAEVTKSRNVDRLVVFIDELDRCTPETVVETLDSMRTFLGATGCVFVVAADQAVLEEALTRRARQVTPVNRSNPYYSSGSEYLDKTFHYQMQVPPLLPRRLSGYAAALVRDKPGVWRDVESVDAVVSVLIPNHVRSPRRAKTLLNSFAMTYDLARRRSQEGHIAGDIASRGRELAFLTCLRVEFPLFANELRQHPDLVDAVRSRLGLGGAMPAQFAPEVDHLAQMFLRGDERTDVILADDLDEEAVDSGDEADEEEAPDEDATDLPPTTMTKVQSRLLELYFRKTSRVPSPRQDLVHLEGRGARFGLDAFVADQLDDAGTQGDIEQVRDVLERLGEDRWSGIRALAESLDRDVAPLGEEAANLATVLLQVYAENSEAIPSDQQHQLTSQCAAAMDAHLDSYDLESEDLPGALALGIDSASASGRSLSTSVVEHPAAMSDDAVARTLLNRMDAANDLSSLHVGRIVGAALGRAGSTLEGLVELIAVANPESAVGVLESATGQLSSDLKMPASEDTDEGEQAAQAAQRLDRCRRLVAAFTSPDIVGRRDLSQRVAYAILRSDSVEARSAVLERLGDLVNEAGAITHRGLADEALRAAARRRLEAIPVWLKALEASTLGEDRQQPLDVIAEKIWAGRSDLEDLATDAGELLDHVSRLLQNPLGPDSRLATSVTAELEPVTDAASAELQRSLLEDEQTFLLAGVLDEDGSADARRQQMLAGLSSQLAEANLADGSVGEYYLTAVPLTATRQTNIEGDLTLAVRESPWLASPMKEALAIQAAASATEAGQTIDPPYTAVEIDQLIDTHGPAVAEAVSVWIRHFAEQPEAAAASLTRLLDRGARVEGAVREQVRAYSGTLSSEQLDDFLGHELTAILERDAREDLLSAAEIGRIDADVFVARLAELGSACTNNEQRGRVLSLWQSYGPIQGEPLERLFESVLFPMLHLNAGAFSTVLRYPSLWSNPPDRRRMRTKLLEAAARHGKTGDANRAMARAGLRRRKPLTGFLGTPDYEDVD